MKQNLIYGSNVSLKLFLFFFLFCFSFVFIFLFFSNFCKFFDRGLYCCRQFTLSFLTGKSLYLSKKYGWRKSVMLAVSLHSGVPFVCLSATCFSWTHFARVEYKLADWVSLSPSLHSTGLSVKTWSPPCFAERVGEAEGKEKFSTTYWGEVEWTNCSPHSVTIELTNSHCSTQPQNSRWISSHFEVVLLVMSFTDRWARGVSSLSLLGNLR